MPLAKNVGRKKCNKPMGETSDHAPTAEAITTLSTTPHMETELDQIERVQPKIDLNADGDKDEEDDELVDAQVLIDEYVARLEVSTVATSEAAEKAAEKQPKKESVAQNKEVQEVSSQKEAEKGQGSIDVPAKGNKVEKGLTSSSSDDDLKVLAELSSKIRKRKRSASSSAEFVLAPRRSGRNK